MERVQERWTEKVSGERGHFIASTSELKISFLREEFQMKGRRRRGEKSEEKEGDWIFKGSGLSNTNFNISNASDLKRKAILILRT